MRQNEIIFILGLILIGCLLGCKEEKDKVYLVEETGYIHYSKEDGSCKFIDQAKRNGYNLKKISIAAAPYYKYKICKMCFSMHIIQEYDKKLNDIILSDSRNELERARKDSLINSVSEEVREAIIEDYLENQGNDYDDSSYPEEDNHWRYN